MPKIHLTTTDGASLEFELTAERTTVGRAEGNDFVVPDGSVSSRHGEILLQEDGSIEFVDLGSTNGTHVNGERVERAHIAPGGAFKLGSCDGYLEGEAGAAAAAVEEPSAAVEEEAFDSPEESASAWAPAPAGPAAVISGLGATPCPAQLRHGFGPKKPKKGTNTSSTVMLLGVAALIACAAACFMILRMGA